MGKDLKGKELGIGITQRKDGYYVGRYTTFSGKRKQKILKSFKNAESGLRMQNMTTNTAISIFQMKYWFPNGIIIGSG